MLFKVINLSNGKNTTLGYISACKDEVKDTVLFCSNIKNSSLLKINGYSSEIMSIEKDIHTSMYFGYNDRYAPIIKIFDINYKAPVIKPIDINSKDFYTSANITYNGVFNFNAATSIAMNYQYVGDWHVANPIAPDPIPVDAARIAPAQQAQAARYGVPAAPRQQDRIENFDEEVQRIRNVLNANRRF